jgi:hypothetical protein
VYSLSLIVKKKHRGNRGQTFGTDRGFDSTCEQQKFQTAVCPNFAAEQIVIGAVLPLQTVIPLMASELANQICTTRFHRASVCDVMREHILVHSNRTHKRAIKEF